MWKYQIFYSSFSRKGGTQEESDYIYDTEEEAEAIAKERYDALMEDLKKDPAKFLDTVYTWYIEQREITVMLDEDEDVEK